MRPSAYRVRHDLAEPSAWPQCLRCDGTITNLRCRRLGCWPAPVGVSRGGVCARRPAVVTRNGTTSSLGLRPVATADVLPVGRARVAISAALPAGSHRAGQGVLAGRDTGDDRRRHANQRRNWHLLAPRDTTNHDPGRERRRPLDTPTTRPRIPAHDGLPAQARLPSRLLATGPTCTRVAPVEKLLPATCTFNASRHLARRRLASAHHDTASANLQRTGQSIHPRNQSLHSRKPLVTNLPPAWNQSGAPNVLET
jgi:hypothetical protein